MENYEPGMTVGELREVLAKYPDNALIRIATEEDDFKLECVTPGPNGEPIMCPLDPMDDC